MSSTREVRDGKAAACYTQPGYSAAAWHSAALDPRVYMDENKHFSPVYPRLQHGMASAEIYPFIESSDALELHSRRTILLMTLTRRSYVCPDSVTRLVLYL
jgi:hypothetical protein